MPQTQRRSRGLVTFFSRRGTVKRLRGRPMRRRSSPTEEVTVRIDPLGALRSWGGQRQIGEKDGRRKIRATEASDDGPEALLIESAVSGQTPPAGPQWLRGLAPLAPLALHYEKPLGASLDGFTLHAATRAGGLDAEGREALLRYVLRPPLAQERLEPRPDGLVRIALKRAYADGTVAVDMDPLSLLCRLATSVPPPRFHTVKYAGVLASASAWRSRIGRPKPAATASSDDVAAEPAKRKRAATYRPWAELLARTFAVDVLECPKCKGRMKLIALVKKPESIARFLAGISEPTCVPERWPPRGPPYWRSTVLRRKAA